MVYQVFVVYQHCMILFSVSDHYWLCFLSKLMLAIVRWPSSLQGSLYHHLTLSDEQMITEFTSTVDWHISPIRAFAWHPHTKKFALASKDDSVRIQTIPSGVVPILKHRFQKGVTILAWKPHSGSVLAIGCQNCILIWTIDPLSLSTRPSSSCAQVLQQSGHGPVTSIDWHPEGTLLVSASAADISMIIWDVSKEIGVPLRRVGGGGVSSVHWSLDKVKLFSTTPSSVFRIWETYRWTYDKYKLPGRCQAACWSPNGRVLLFATVKEPVIFYLQFHTDQNETPPTIGGSKAAIPLVDLSEVLYETGEQNHRVGGIVQDMAWDPTGERLAVIFKSNGDKNHSCYNKMVALFRTRTHPVVDIAPCGYVRGENGDTPNIIRFQPNFKRGALLTVCWSSGKVQFIPLIFITESSLAHQQQTTPITANGSTSRRIFSVDR